MPDLQRRNLRVHEEPGLSRSEVAERPGDIELRLADGGKKDGRVGFLPEERGTKRLREQESGCLPGRFVHHSDCNRIPEALHRAPRLSETGQPLIDRDPRELLVGALVPAAEGETDLEKLAGITVDQ